MAFYLLCLNSYLYLSHGQMSYNNISDNPEVSPSALCLRKPSLITAVANKLHSFDDESCSAGRKAGICISFCSLTMDCILNSGSWMKNAYKEIPLNKWKNHLRFVPKASFKKAHQKTSLQKSLFFIPCGYCVLEDMSLPRSLPLSADSVELALNSYISSRNNIQLIPYLSVSGSFCF